MHFQLADISTKKCQGIIEDVSVKWLDLYYLVDVVLLDTDEIPFILERPFLGTSYAVIHCGSNKMEFSFRDHKTDLNISKYMSATLYGCEVEEACIADSLVTTKVHTQYHEFLLQQFITYSRSYFDLEDFIDEVNKMLESVHLPECGNHFSETCWVTLGQKCRRRCI